MSSTYINQIDAAIGAIAPQQGQNLSVTPSPSGGLVIALNNSISVPGSVTASTGVILKNPGVATSQTNEYAAPSLVFTGSYWNNALSQGRPDSFSLDVTMIGASMDNQSIANLTLNHTGSGVANFVMGNMIFRFMSNGENVFGTASSGSFNIETERSDGSLFPLISAAAAVGATTTYHGSISVTDPAPGQYVTITGFVNSGNNGRFIVQSSTTGLLGTGTLTVYNPNGVLETGATATSTTDSATASFGNISSEGFGNNTGLHINGTAYNVTMGSEAEPSAVPFVVNMGGNATDVGFLRIINNGATGEHGLEIGAIIDGTGTAPLLADFGIFNGAPALELNSVVASTGITLGVPAPQLQFTGTVWTGSASIEDGWVIKHVPTWNIAQGAVSNLTVKHTTAGAVTNFNFDGSIQSVFGQSSSWAIGPTSVQSLITPTGLISFVVSTVTAASTAVGGLTTYTWTIGGSTAANITAGMYFTISGFTNPGNNGRFQVQSTPTTTSLILFNPNGVSESTSAVATLDNPYAQGGTWECLGDLGAGHYGILGTTHPINENISPAPNNIALAITPIGDTTDSAWHRVINTSATNGNHGYEIGAVIDGTGANPIVLQIGNFGVVGLNIPNQVAATSSLEQSSPTVLLGGNYWTGSASAIDQWTLQEFLYIGHAYTLTSAADFGGGRAVYVTTDTNPLPPVSSTVRITGFTNLSNNGTFTVIDNRTGSFVVNNPGGVTETHAGSATVTVIPASTSSLVVNHSGASNAQILIPQGSGAVPQLSFIADPSCGLKYIGASQLELVAGGETFGFSSQGGLFIGAAALSFLSQEATISGIADPVNVYSLTAASNASLGNTTYTGTFSPVIPTGAPVNVTGFTNSGNNVVFAITVSCNPTTLVLVNPNGVAESHAATAQTANPCVYAGGGGATPNNLTSSLGLPKDAYDPPAAGVFTTSQAGRTWFNTNTSAVSYWDGTTSQTLQNRNLVTKTTTYLATASDHTINCNATGAGFTVTVPITGISNGHEYSIKKIDSSANTVTIVVTGGANIDGSASFILTTQYESITIVWDAVAAQYWIY